MTREEAISLLYDMKDTYDEIHENTNYEIGYEQMTALDIAIEALHREEAEEKGYCHRINYIPKPCENANCDCVAVVRCKDCRHYEDGMVGYCWEVDRGVSGDFFCAYGERREK